MKRFLALLVLGVLAILSLASVPQASAASREVVGFQCNTSNDTITITTYSTTDPVNAPLVGTSCTNNDKILVGKHYRLAALSGGLGTGFEGFVYELFIRGGGDD